MAVGAALAAGIWLAPPPIAAQEVAPPPAGTDAELQGNAEVLTRGPVHEAFAEPYTQDAEAGIIVDREPPEAIDELPPEAMPEGTNVEWIPGYWAWDDDRADFIWISGVWRDVPPGQRWVPGSWVQVSGGFQWTPGFWTSAETQEVSYLPEPPSSEEVGPNAPAPDDNHFWVPGIWQYQNNDYAWRPGYWAPAYQDWVWVPARYVWTPRGVVFVNGYWDFHIARRGVLFSPVFFGDYRYPGYVPRHVVPVGPLLIHLFVRPRYHHYYYGDWYGNSYVNIGIVPWIGVRQFAYYQYDPLFAFYQTGFFNVQGGGFLGRIAGWHHYYDRHPDHRPRRTWADARDFDRQRGDRDENVVRQALLTQSFDEYRRADDREVDLRDVDQAQRERLVRRSQEIRDLQQERRKIELRGEGRQQADAKLTLPQVERQGPAEATPERPDRGERGPRSDERRARPDLDERPGERPQPGKRPQPDRQPGERPDRGERPQPGERPAERPQPGERPQPDRQPGERPDRGERPQPGRQPAERPQPERPDRGARPERPDAGATPDSRPERQPRRGRPDMGIPDAPADSGRDIRPIPRPSEPVPQQPRRGERRGRSAEPGPQPDRGAQPAPRAPRREANPPSGGGRSPGDSDRPTRAESPRTPQGGEGSERGGNRPGREPR
jgi:hypothetical protein